jgi:alkylhydroperoxidase family enzyme
LPNDLKEPVALVDSIRSRRGGQLLNLDRMLLHSPQFAQGWNSMFSVIRGNSLSVPSKYREMAICAIAVLNKAEYEFYQHENVWRAAGGTNEQIIAIRQLESPLFKSSIDSTYFDNIEKEILELTIQMTKQIQVDPDLLNSIKSKLGNNDAAVVELVGTIAGYNMVSRFLVALNITADGEM